MNKGGLMIADHKAGSFDVQKVRADFPILSEKIRGKDLVFLDSAASAQKPQQMIDCVADFYAQDYANIHRGVYELSQRATIKYEKVRDQVRSFLNAAKSKECIFLRGTTEAVNLVAHSYVAPILHEGDEVLITELEHHSNIVPWQLLCADVGANLKVARLQDDGQVDLDHYYSLLSDRTKFVSIAHVSNALGTINPVRRMIEAAHAKGVKVMLDGAQAAPHVEVDVQALDCDFYAFSAHKLYGPTGVGVLYGKLDVLEGMRPYQSGGDMILQVSFEKTTFNALPHRLEAGTPNIAGVVALGASLSYLDSLDWAGAHAHEAELLAYATEELRKIDSLRIIGDHENKSGVISFHLDRAHPHDIGTILDAEGIAIRAGHHCAQPVMERYGLAATARASFGIYNNTADVDALVMALQRVNELF